MTQHDDWNDLLTDASYAADTDGVAQPGAVRGRAQRRRALGRATTAMVLTAAAAAVVTGAAVGLPDSDRADLLPADPTPTATATRTPPPLPTSTPTSVPVRPTPPTAATPDTTTQPPAPPPVTQADLDALRFDREAEWLTRTDLTTTIVEGPADWISGSCLLDVTAPPSVAGRTVTIVAIDGSSSNQVLVFDDAETAAREFATLRVAIRSCQAAWVQSAFLPGATEFTGAQLALADESFWTAHIPALISQPDGEPVLTGEEGPGTVDLLVLDRNVVTVLTGIASSPEGRADAVVDLSAEWQALRPLYQPALR